MPKILFINHPEEDCFEALLYLGLCQLLGPDQVVDFPYKPSYHGKLHRYSNVTYITTGMAEPGDAKFRRDSVGPYHYTPVQGEGQTGPYPWMPTMPGHERSIESIVSDIDSFDLVVLTSPRKRNMDILVQLINAVGRNSFKAFVMIDGEDSTTTRWDCIEKFSPSVYFKTQFYPPPFEVYPEEKNRVEGRARIVSIPFCSPIPAQPEAKKDIDVMFVGQDTCGGCLEYPNARKDAVTMLKASFGTRFVGGLGEYVEYGDYLDMLNRAKVAVSIRGFTPETLKYWEAPSFIDTLLVSDKYELPRPFQDGVQCAYFRDLVHMVEVIKVYLADDEKRIRVAREGNKLLRQAHTAKARAEQFLMECFK